MKRLPGAVIVFLSLLFACPRGAFEQETADNAQVPVAEASKASFFDNVSDWYATLGKATREGKDPAGAPGQEGRGPGSEGV